MLKLTKVKINNLLRVRDYTIIFEDNKLILVGENGSGKTTVFRLLYYVLSTEWESIHNVYFDTIELYFDSKEPIVIESSWFPSIDEKLLNMILRRYPINFKKDISSRNIYDYIIDLLAEKDTSNSKSEYVFFNEIIHYFPQENMMNIKRVSKLIRDNFPTMILYLPTYRRIEEQFKNIFSSDVVKEIDDFRNKHKKDNSIELIEFGMDDVDEAVQNKQASLREFSRTNQNKLTLGYLGHVINESYNNLSGANKIKQLSDEQINDVLARIEEDILSAEQKQRIFDIITQVKNDNWSRIPKHVKMICFYFTMLLEFHQALEQQEIPFISFRDICNKYLIYNRIKYDSSTFSCKPYNIAGDFTEEIRFQDLSSGEKQIVSIFSHLNLSNDSNFFVFIDEPELSLSVEWQKSFLVDINKSINCVGLIATTHSPFIFDNELEKYVHGINEFCTRG